MSENKRFRLTDESMMHEGTEVFRIEALQDFGVTDQDPIRKGELGGFLESEDNLSQEVWDGSWVYDDSVVKGESVVEDNSIVRFDSVVKGNSKVQALSGVYWGAVVEDSKVFLEGNVYGSRYNQVGYAHVKDSTIGNRSELVNGDLINSKVVGSELNGRHVKDSTVTDSKLEHMTIVEDSQISNSYIGFQNEIKSSEVTNSFVDEHNDLMNQKVVDEKDYGNDGISLSDEDIQDLDGDSLEL